MSVSAIGSPASISSTQRIACRESCSLRTSIHTLVSTTITSARDDSRRGPPPSGHAPAGRGRRYADGERPALAMPRPPPRASFARQSPPELRAVHGRRSRCSSSYTTRYTSQGVFRAKNLDGEGGKFSKSPWPLIRQLHEERFGRWGASA